MILSDKLNYFIESIGYKFGSLLARYLLQNIGDRSKVHISVRYWLPTKIYIGKDCEIRNNSFFDARSAHDIGIKIGDKVRIKDAVCFAAYGGKISVGNNVLIGGCSTILGHGDVSIGDYSMIGQNTNIVSSNHLSIISDIPFQEQGFTREKIDIGNNVWIGANTSILAGSEISSSVVVGSGSVVSGRLPSGYLYGGVPAKPLKQLDNKIPENVNIYVRDWGLF